VVAHLLHSPPGRCSSNDRDVILAGCPQALHPVEPSRIHLLSLGTGQVRQFISGADHDWGVLQWAPKLPEVRGGPALPASLT
jgi:hypothetical protein